MGIRATDRNRNLFLKGFKLSNSGMNEDPTYLGFKIVFDPGILPINPEYGWAPSPLLRAQNYTEGNGASFATSLGNPFGQPQYERRQSDVIYYSAYNYLIEREANFPGQNTQRRAQALRQFQKLLQEINTNSPWFFQSIDGLDELGKLNSRDGWQNEDGLDNFNPQRTSGNTLIINCLESLNLRISALADLYNQATFDYDNMRYLVPRNLRKFTMWIFVTEIRNFFKTSRLTASSTALTALDNLSSLLTTNRNPGSSVIDQGNGQYSAGGFNLGAENPTPGGGMGGAFNSFVNNVFDGSGLSNDVQAFTNQQDQSGIKPVMIYECQQCEFDFNDSTPIKSTIDMGSSSADPEKNSFKIHVGKVRTKNQYPNIRQDKKPLILADGWDQNRSSYQFLSDDTLSLENLLGLGQQALTNVVSNAVSDLVNEGINQFIDPVLSGIDQSLLGNIYSFNPSQLGRMTSQNGSFGFNNLENFLNGAAETGIDNIFKGNLPNPQTMGEGGPTERVYPPVPPTDVYGKVPGEDLGVPERVYPGVNADVYENVPGEDLGVPDRVYPTVNDDVYDNVPGTDLGVPDRVYADPSGDAYPDVPGADLGVPGRVYQNPSGDAYPDVPGADLGVPDRAYPDPGGDAYPDVPGADLGVPDRAYPDPGGDVYSNVPGQDLGVPDRAYPDPGGDVYSNVPGQDLGVPDRNYNRTIGENDVYSNSNFTTDSLESTRVYGDDSLVSSRGELRSPENTFTEPPGQVYSQRKRNTPSGEIGNVYPVTNGDFIIERPLNLGNSKPADKYNVSLGDYNPDEYEEQ